MAASTGSGNYDVVVQAYNANTFATISSGDTVTLTDNVTGCNFFKIEAGATLVCNGFSITVDNDSSNHSFINNGTISGVLDVIITNPNGQSNFNANGQGGNVRNLTVNNAGAVVTLSGEDQTLDGDLTITAGQLTTNDGSADRNLTVTGDVSVTGTLTGNASAISFGSLTINSGGIYDATSGTTTLTYTSSGYSINNAGTFTHNNGTVKIDFETPNYNANSKIKLNQMYNLEVEMNRTTDMTLLEPESGTTLTALNNVTVKKGVLTKNSHTHTLDFKGLTVVGVGGGSLAAHIDASTSGTATSNFGSLTILTDGKYTQSTTTNVGSIRNVGGTIA